MLGGPVPQRTLQTKLGRSCGSMRSHTKGHPKYATKSSVWGLLGDASNRQTAIIGEQLKLEVLCRLTSDYGKDILDATSAISTVTGVLGFSATILSKCPLEI